jgi:hypothetical protein
MNDFTFRHLSETLNGFTLTSLQNDASDLALLKWMLHQLYTTLGSHKGMSTTKSPLFNQKLECNQLQHNITVYQPQCLHTEKEFRFLSLLGKKQRHLAQAIGSIEAELITLPGIVSHSSLVLPDGNTSHLMIYDGSQTQMSLSIAADQKLSTDQRAQQYYKWIRLHDGTILRDRSDQYTILPDLTRYYSFHPNIPLPGVPYIWSDHFRTTVDA